MSGTDARRAAVTREGEPRGAEPKAGDRALARVARGCKVMAFVVRLQAVFAVICLILAVAFTHDLVTRALDAGAPDVWTAPVMAAVLIWGITCIFEYGVVLQRQDDETL